MYSSTDAPRGYPIWLSCDAHIFVRLHRAMRTSRFLLAAIAACLFHSAASTQPACPGGSSEVDPNTYNGYDFKFVGPIDQNGGSMCYNIIVGSKVRG